MSSSPFASVTQRRTPRFPSAAGSGVILCLSIFLMLAPQRSTSAQDSAPDPAGATPVEFVLEGEASLDLHDPSVPTGAVRAFIDACRAGDYDAAAARLDLSHLPAHERATEGPSLARRFKIVLDRKLWIQFERLSDRPEGLQDDGLPADLDLVGPITDGIKVDVLIRRVQDEDRRLVWKFAASTVEAIPALYAEFGYGKIGEVLPSAMFELRFLEIPLAQCVGLLSLVAIAWVLAWMVVAATRPAIRALVSRTRSDLDDRAVRLLARPLIFLLALAIFEAGTHVLRLAAPVLDFLKSLEIGLALVGITWGVLRLLDVASDLTIARFDRAENAAAKAAVPLARRALKVLLMMVAAIALLQNLGFNVTGLIAGLGVGGLAFALAAQKSIENLFGGVTLITDRPVKVGDFCRFGDGKLGTVEEIGLRSTRVRTLERTVVTVPNATFAELQLENFAPRDRVRLLTTLGLRYETSADQLRYVLAGLREVLIGHPRVAEEPLRVRFSGFGESSLDVEILAYVDTRDFGEFCAIREDLFLRFMDVVERGGTAIAFPSRTLYVGRERGLSTEQVEQAEEAVRAWREEGRLPFPDLPAETVDDLRNRLDYPPTGSTNAGG